MRAHSIALKLGSFLDWLGEMALNWDHAALRWVSENPLLKKLDGLWVLLTYLGDGYIWGLIGFYLILAGSQVDRRNVLITMAILVVEITVFRMFKAFYARPRPELLAGGLNRRQLVLDFHSFPSGHATIGFGVAYLISYFYPYWPVMLLTYLLAGGIALSRIYLREHFPLDVVGGALLGTSMSWVLAPLFCSLIH
jgi:undecaprenyl-diphosphatase